MTSPNISLSPDRPGSPIDFARLATGLWRARWLFFAVLAAGAVIGYGTAKVTMSPNYRAEAALVWDSYEIRDAAAQSRMLRTLAESIELPAILEEVRRRTGVSMSVDEMDNAIFTNVGVNSNLLRVYATSTDPQLAVKLANTAIEVFIEQQREALRERVVDIVDSAKVVRDAALQELQAARLAYDQFREKEGILDLRAERTAAIEKAALLETTADQARAELEAQIERVRVFTQAKDRISDKVVISETESAPAVLALAKARAELEQLRGVLTEDHPRVQALAAQVQTLEKLLDTDLQPVVGQRVVARHPQRDVLENGLLDAEAEQQAARKRERTYHDMMDATKHELAELIRLEGKASELITVLELAEKRYAQAEAAVSQAEDVARTQTTGLRMASAATPPHQPLPERRRILVAAGIPVLLVLVTAIILLVFRLRTLKVSSTKEVAFWGNGPVVAAASWPVSNQTVQSLRDELSDSLRGRSGTTLLVPFSDAEAPLADELLQSIQGNDAQASQPKREKSPPRPPLDDAAFSVYNARGGTELRRSCRDVSRVLVLVKIRAHSHFSIYQIQARLGRKQGIGFAVVGIGHELVNMPDRVGDVEGFWGNPVPPSDAY